MKAVVDTVSRNHKIRILEQIYGSKIRNYPNWWLDSRYEDFSYYGCTPAQYKQLLRSRS